MSAGHRLRDLRKELKLSQKDIGNLLNVAQQVVSHYEKTGNIDASKLMIISDKYGIDIRYFFEEKPLDYYKSSQLELNSSSGVIIPAGWNELIEEVTEMEYGKIRIIESVLRTLIKELKN